jgi:heme/copper-type cytochrome/quinol oxidase subunit 2
MTKLGRWPLAVCALLALVVLVAPLPVPAGGFIPEGGAAGERFVHVDARMFAYEPAVVNVNPGDRVTIELAADDVVHGLYVDGYNLNVTADPGQPATLTFVAGEPGSFRFRCSVTCGALHPFMTGRLEVGPNLTLWRAAGLAVLAAVAGLCYARR